MDIAERIAQLREAKNIRKADMARALDMDASHYNKFEKRGDKLTLEQLEGIARVLEVSMVELFTGEVQNEIDKEENEKLGKRIDELEATLSIYNERLESMRAIVLDRLKELALLYFAIQDMDEPGLEQPTPFPTSIYQITSQNSFWHFTEEAITLGKLGLIEDETLKRHYQKSLLEWSPLTIEEIDRKRKLAYHTNKKGASDKGPNGSV